MPHYGSKDFNFFPLMFFDIPNIPVLYFLLFAKSTEIQLMIKD